MRPTQQEFAHPREWLTRLATETDGYRRLLTESGGLGRAAYRLARARCAPGGGEPCLEDLQAAAALLAQKLGGEGALPIKSLLPRPRSAPPLSPSGVQRVAGAKSRPRASRVSA